jgi:hypothetical protein
VHLWRLEGVSVLAGVGGPVGRWSLWRWQVRKLLISRRSTGCHHIRLRCGVIPVGGLLGCWVSTMLLRDAIWRVRRWRPVVRGGGLWSGVVIHWAGCTVTQRGRTTVCQRLRVSGCGKVSGSTKNPVRGCRLQFDGVGGKRTGYRFRAGKNRTAQTPTTTLVG